MINKKLKNTYAFFYASIVSGLYPLAGAYAQINLTQNLNGAPGVDFTIKKLLDILLGISCWLSRAAILIIISALAFYGFMFFKSQGNPSVMTEAKSALKWGLVGILVIFGVYTIIRTVAATLGADIAPDWLPLSCPYVG